MTVVPRSAFGRTLTLLLALAAFIIAGTLLVGGAYRKQSLTELIDQVARTRLQLIAPVIATLGPEQSRRFVAEEYGAQGLRLAPHPVGGRPAVVASRLVERRLRISLGERVEARVLRGESAVLWLRAPETGGLWLGMPLPKRSERTPTLFMLWIALIAVIAVIAALWFARQLSAPLRKLAAIAPALVRGEPPADFQPSGPRELRALSGALLQAAHQAKQLREERELWLAGVSHDLRTPLARLRLSAEMLPETLDLRAGMIEDVEGMDEMLGQFLDYLRLGREEKAERRDVVALLSDALARVPGAEAVPIDGRLFAAVRPRSFARALVNLVLNALRHGAVPVQIQVGSGGGWGWVQVHDAGAGFAPEALARLSAPFAQGEAARSAGGSGLGLAIAARVADLHGGELYAQRDGAGFSVGMRWPLGAGATDGHV